MPENDFDDYLVAILTAIADGRMEIRTLLDMTPEQREQWKARLVTEEKDEIQKGLDRHAPPQPEAPSDARTDDVDPPNPNAPKGGGGKGNPV